jgi:hypothetical protein
MTHLFLLVASMFGGEQSKPDNVEVSRLISQLGSDSFQKREAASKVLFSLGERTLPALEVAKSSPDPEVKRRASRLVKAIEEAAWRHQIQPVMKSKLSALEKGRRLKAIIIKGTTRKRLELVLGQGFAAGAALERVSGGIDVLYYYPHSGLQIWFFTPPNNSCSTVASVEIMNEERQRALEALSKTIQKK